MRRTSNLNNKQQKRNVLSALWTWISKPRVITIEIPVCRWWKTKAEKEAILKSYLARAFGDYDRATGQVNVFPAMRAADEVKKMQQQGTVDYYFEFLVLNQKHLKATQRLARKHNMGRIAA